MKIEWEEEKGKREQTRQELIENAAQIFRQKGFKKTKLDDIASFSKTGKTALYHYFENKKSIFTAVVNREVSMVYREIESYTLAGAEVSDFAKLEDFSSLAALERYVDIVVKVSDKVLRKYLALFLDYALFQKLIQSTIEVFKEQNVLLLETILGYGTVHGQLGLTKDDVNLAAYSIFRLCSTYYSDMILGINFQIGPAELKKIVCLISAK